MKKDKNVKDLIQTAVKKNKNKIKLKSLVKQQ